MVLAEPEVHLDSVPNPSVPLIQHKKPKADKPKAEGGWGEAPHFLAVYKSQEDLPRGGEAAGACKEEEEVALGSSGHSGWSGRRAPCPRARHGLGTAGRAPSSGAAPAPAPGDA